LSNTNQVEHFFRRKTQRGGQWQRANQEKNMKKRVMTTCMYHEKNIKRNGIITSMNREKNMRRRAMVLGLWFKH
jgi:hypothetical protein